MGKTLSKASIRVHKGAAQIEEHALPNRQINLLLARCRPDGECEWVRTGVGNVSITPNMDLGLDQAGNVFVHVEGGAAFEGSNLPGNVPFLAKLNAEGKILWALRAPGYNGSAAVAPDGSVFWAGPLNPGLRITRYSPDGQLLWTRQPRVAGFDVHVDSVAVDDQGDCFVPGPSLGSEISFDGVTTPAAAGTETYLVKYSAAGKRAGPSRPRV